jgi:hypothetical protein
MSVWYCSKFDGLLLVTKRPGRGYFIEAERAFFGSFPRIPKRLVYIGEFD